jgi:DNA gyrase subunit B
MLNEIKVLGELDHIRKRPGMYIGDTKNPTHLIKELLDNALDELLNSYADSVYIEYDNLGNASVSDNGRGFPIHEVVLPDGKKEDSVIASVGRLFSGAKFDDNTYNVSKGTHGVGLSAVNALSKTMTLTIKDRTDKNIIHYYEFNNGELSKHQVGKLNTELNFSTKVTFCVDEQYFSSIQFDIDSIKTELFLISAKYPNNNIYINNQLVPHGTMDDFVKWIIGIGSSTPLFKVNHTTMFGEEIDIYFTYENSNLEPCGDVNLGICSGTYINSFASLFYNVVKEEYENQLSRSEILNGLRFYISLKIKEPKYDSQNKTRMVKNVNYLLTNIKNQLGITLTNSFFKTHFKEIIESKQIKQASKLLKSTGSRVSISNPLKDCEKTPGDILYILEGDSAEGTLKEVRDSRTQAILPVNGKILNSIKIGIDKAVTTKIKYILEAIGVNPNIKKNNYRYDKIKVICDADPDGLHISVLISIAIWKFAPELITQSRFSIIIPPLYGASKGRTFVPIYNQKDVASYSSQGYTIKRFKGLGEMNARELDVIIKNPIEYYAQIPNNDKEQSFVYESMTDPTLKKRICNDSRFSLNNLTKKLLNEEFK